MSAHAKREKPEVLPEVPNERNVNKREEGDDGFIVCSW